MTDQIRNKSSESTDTVYRFGPYEVDRASGQVRKHGIRIRLAGQSLQLLYILLERAGEPVTREELKERLWPSDVFVRFETSLNSAVKKLRQALNDNAGLPRYIETQSRKGYRFVAPVERSFRSSDFEPVTVTPPLESSSSSNTLDEKASPTELLSDTVTPAIERGSAMSSAQWYRGRWFVATTVLLVAFFAGRYIWVLHRMNKAAQAAASSPRSRSTIAVLGFKNLSEAKNENWLSTAFSEMISTELQQGGQVRAIPTETVAQVKRDLDLQEKDGYTRDGLRKVRDILGCDYVVAGSYLVLPGTDNQEIRLDIRVQESLSAETLTSLSVTGKHDELFDLVARAGREMRNRLAGNLTPEGDLDWRTFMPNNPEAAQAYSEGIAQLQLSEDEKAAELLERANTLEPGFALGHSALADAWSSLGYLNRAQAEAAKAVSLMGGATQNVRLNVEARQYELQQDWPGAVAAYSHLLLDHPDDLEVGLKLVGAQVNARDFKGALTTIFSLRALRKPDAADPRIDLAEASIAKRQGNFPRQLELAQSAGQKAEKRGSQLLVARAKLLEGAAADAQAQWTQATRAYQEARAIFERAGNRDGAATALNDIAIVMEREGDLHGAQETLELGRREFQEIGDEGALGATLANLGENYRAQGNVIEAQESYESALAIFVKTGRSDYQRIVKNNLGRILLGRGKIVEARQKFEELLEAWQLSNDQSGIAHAQMNLADVLRIEGDSSRALHLTQSATNIFKKLGDRSNAAQAEGTSGVIYFEMGDMSSARRSLEEALKANEEIGAKGDAASDRLQLAKVAIEEGNPGDAITQSTNALDTLKKEQRGPDEQQAEIVLANALLADGKTMEAKRVLAEASAVHNGDWLTQFELTLVASRIAAATGDRVEAKRRFALAKAEAKKAACGLCDSELHNLKNLRASL